MDVSGTNASLFSVWQDLAEGMILPKIRDKVWPINPSRRESHFRPPPGAFENSPQKGVF